MFNKMDMSKHECAPTFCRSFLGSIAFMHFVLGLDSGGPILASSIITGMATDCYMLKRKAVQRPPLKVWHVEWLEKLACGKVGRSAIDQVAAGFFCYLVYARARFSDGQNSGGFMMDSAKVSGETRGFIEATLSRSKTSNTLERKTRYLPMAAQITGLYGSSCYGLDSRNGKDGFGKQVRLSSSATSFEGWRVGHIAYFGRVGNSVVEKAFNGRSKRG